MSGFTRLKKTWGISRRDAVRSAFAFLVTSALNVSRPMLARAEQPLSVDWDALRRRLGEKLVIRSSGRYEIWRRSLVWQMRKPDRTPLAIIRAESVDDVVETVEFARENGLKISVRTGGHAYNASFLQENVIVLDIGRLNSVDIDPDKKTARVQPGIRSVDLMEMLEEKGLSFPAAHCGAVPMGGFLLGGGLGWNGEEWNTMSCFNILEVEVVTASGDVIVANENENSDYYWAARGAGPCFFGVITSYKLRLYDHPASVVTSSYFWPMAMSERACSWAARMSRELPENVEFLFILMDAPESVSKQGKEIGKVCCLQATAFSQNSASARALLEPLSELPENLESECLLADEYADTPIKALYEWDATSYPQWRWAVDCLWTDSPPEALVAAIAGDIEEMPSEKSSSLMLFKPRSRNLPENAAFSMIGDVYFATYAIWGAPTGDAANIEWVDNLMKKAEPFAKGHYINESSYIAKPERLRNSFTPDAWERLQQLAEKHDPSGVFFRLPVPEE